MKVHSAVLGIAMLAAALPASAEEAVAAKATESSSPIGWARVRAGWGLPNLAEVSLSVTALRPLIIEVGESVMHLGPYGRIGYMWSLKDDRSPEGNGQTIEFSLLGGARYLSFTTSYGPVAGAGVNAAATLDGTWWVAQHFGVTTQIAAGGTYWLQGFQYAPSGFDPLVLDLRMAVGLAF